MEEEAIDAIFPWKSLVIRWVSVKLRYLNY